MDDNDRQWNPGDAVQWTHQTQRGRSTQMSAWEGKVESIRADGVVIVKRRGKLHAVHPTRLRGAGERTELTDMIRKMVEAHRG